MDRVGEGPGIEPSRRGIARTLRAIGSQDDVEMGEAPALELDHLHVREPHRRPQLPFAQPAVTGHLEVETQ